MFGNNQDEKRFPGAIPIKVLEEIHRSKEYRQAVLLDKLEYALMDYKETKKQLKELNEEREALGELILNLLHELSVEKEEIIDMRNKIGI